MSNANTQTNQHKNTQTQIQLHRNTKLLFAIPLKWQPSNINWEDFKCQMSNTEMLKLKHVNK